MRIALLHASNDPACVGWNLYNAINKYTGHTARHITGNSTYIGPNQEMMTGADVVLNKKGSAWDEARDIINDADILHFNQYDWTEPIYQTDIPFIKLMNRRDQKLVYHGHGGCWLLDPDKQAERCKGKGAKMVTCSPIDEAVVPGIKWIPNILDMSDPALVPDWNRGFDGQLMASMASHASLYKGDKIAAYVFEFLYKFGYDVMFHLISDLPRSKSFSIRSGHHFTIDNWTQGFFGMAGLEGLALGHITISRLDPLTKKKWFDAFGDIPICDVHGMDECGKKVRDYYNDRDMLLEHSKGNRLWMENNYIPAQVVKLWTDFYEGL